MTAKFHCPTCDKQYFHKKDLIRHSHVHFGLKPYKCRYCTATFNRTEQLKVHLRSNHPDDLKGDSANLRCRLCFNKTMFSSNELLAEHYTQVHESTQSNPCVTEGTSVPAGETDPKSDQIAVSCSECNQTFKAVQDQKRHSVIYPTHIVSFQCSLCEKTYTRRQKLTEHLKTKHGPHPKANKPKAETFDCPECSKSFTVKCRMTRHLVGCRGEKPYSCDECGKCFTQKASVIQHRAYAHQKTKRYLCSDCGQSFYGTTNYKKHCRSHRGIKPYPCTFCGKHFNGQGDLRIHERIHLGIRKFHCTQCDLKFYRPYSLTRHMLVHTGEKPFVCDICGSKFSQGGSLKKHKECHERGGVTSRKPSNEIPEQRRIRIEKKPRESRLLKQMMKNEMHQLDTNRSYESASTSTVVGLESIATDESSGKEEPDVAVAKNSSHARKVPDFLPQGATDFLYSGY